MNATGAQQLVPPGHVNDPPEEVAAAGLAAIVGKLQGVKPFPEAAQRLLLLMWDPEHDTDRVVETIQADPTLTARVLRLINSGAFGLRRKCESVRRSVVLLGSHQVAQIAVAQLALAQFAGGGPSARRIADHCQAVASLCRLLARRRPRLRNVDVFTPGMLHDLGKLLMLQVDQGEYEELIATSPVEPDTTSLQEAAKFGYDHAVLAEHVMRQWKLPDHLCEVISLHHDFEAALRRSASVAESVAVLRFADHLSYVLPGTPHGDPEQIATLAELEEAQLLELDTHRLAQLWPSLFEALS